MRNNRILINICLNRMAMRASNFLDYEITMLLIECKQLLKGEYV